jgi:hypothetical protein
MIYQLEPIQITISKIVRDLGLGDREINWEDFVEWLSEGLKEIGVYYQFTDKQESLTVTDYKAELPCDFYELIRIMGASASTLPMSGNEYLVGDTDQTITDSSFLTNDYKINHNIITVGFKTGTVTILYKGFPIDQEGFPMIPDNVEFRRALFWKVVFQLGIQGFTFKNQLLNNLEYTGRKWGTAKLSARAEGLMPDPMMYERLKNNWLRIIPTNNDFDRKFMWTNKPENLNFDGSK